VSDTLASSAAHAVQRLAFTIPEAAQASTLGVSTIKLLIGTGELRSTLVRGRRLIPVDALEELIQGGRHADARQ
jgi:excisionase family DNA binding protein